MAITLDPGDMIVRSLCWVRSLGDFFLMASRHVNAWSGVVDFISVYCGMFMGGDIAWFWSSNMSLVS